MSSRGVIASICSFVGTVALPRRSLPSLGSTLLVMGGAMSSLSVPVARNRGCR